MAEPLKIRTLAGIPLESAELGTDTGGAPEQVGLPLNQVSLAIAVVQLQKTVAALQTQHNALAVATTHEADKVTATSPQAEDLFTAS